MRPPLSRFVEFSQRPPAGAVAIGLTMGWVAWVDEDDWPAVRNYNWSVAMQGDTGYAQVRIAKRPIRIHSVLLKSNARIDHRVHRIDIKVSDNRRSNLRFASASENSANMRKRRNETSSPFKGVFFDRRRGRWNAQMSKRDDLGRRGSISLGAFPVAVDAARAYDRAAVAASGEFACTNFKTTGAGNWLYDPMPFGLVRHQPEV